MKLEKCCMSCKHFYIIGNSFCCEPNISEFPSLTDNDGVDFDNTTLEYNCIFDEFECHHYEPDPILLIPNCVQVWEEKLSK